MAAGGNREAAHNRGRESSMTISIIIPVMNAAHTIAHILKALETQTCKPDEIIVVDSGSDDGTADVCTSFPEVSLKSIQKSDFNHASTRDAAIRASKGDICVLMTQDAIPADDFLIENLISPFENTSVCMAYGRQLPNAAASPAEVLIRKYNYPAESFLRSCEDIPMFGLRTFFFSNSCAAYRKTDYTALGGFEPSLPANEDMLFAAKAILAGRKTAYVSNACVYHSHDFPWGIQFRRYRDQAIALEMHRDLLPGADMGKEGRKLFRYVSSELLKRGYFIPCLSFCANCTARIFGHIAGKYTAHILREKQNKGKRT